MAQKGTMNSEGREDGVENVIDVDGITYARALSVTDALLDAMVSTMPLLPSRGDCQYLPCTLSEAISYVNAREDAKKKQGVQKLDGNTVAVPAEKEGPYPGALQGAGDEAAFWLYVEDYFRGICREDLHELMEFLRPVEDEDVFDMEPLGRKLGQEMTQDIQEDGDISMGSGLAGVDSTPDGSSGRRRKRAASRLGRSGNAQDIQSSDQNTLMPPEPRSSRRGQRDVVPGSNAATPLLGESVLGQEASDRNTVAMTVTLTPDGAPAKMAIDALDSRKHASMLKTLRALKTMLGVDAPSVPIPEGIEEDRIKADLQTETEVLADVLNCYTNSPDWSKSQGLVRDDEKISHKRHLTSACSSRLRHPWTEMLLKCLVPRHVKETVKQAYYLDPPGSLAQRCAGNINVFDIAQEEYAQSGTPGIMSPDRAQHDQHREETSGKINCEKSKAKMEEDEVQQPEPGGDDAQHDDSSKSIRVEKVSWEVMGVIASGEADEISADLKPNELYEKSTQDLSLISAAPQDEVAAEILAVQAELVSVMASNRARLLKVMQAALEDIPLQLKQYDTIVAEVEFAKRWFEVRSSVEIVAVTGGRNVTWT